MGQYYQPIIIFPDGSSVTFDSHQYGCGIKLMEHSWIGNEFVNAVYSKILINPRRVAGLATIPTMIMKLVKKATPGIYRSKIHEVL